MWVYPAESIRETWNRTVSSLDLDNGSKMTVILEWTPPQWARVMFSDEFRFSLQSDSYRPLIWRTSGTHYHQENIIERHHLGGVGLLVLKGELFQVPELICMFKL
ncbi:HTH_Tnp_Tc3_2 domain-containing protein [Trichonephila clavipes]|nr:HTH_Tnp_Tc3_2 domain-containing protein [Trichonephila clavipes]